MFLSYSAPLPQYRVTWWEIDQVIREACGIFVVSVATVKDVIPLGSWLSAFQTGGNAEKLPNTTVMNKAVISFMAQLLIRGFVRKITIMYACLNQISCFRGEKLLLLRNWFAYIEVLKHKVTREGKCEYESSP